MIFPKSDIRSQIVSILSEEFPLSFRKISNQLRKKYATTISDNAIYKIIACMIREKILKPFYRSLPVNFKVWYDKIRYRV